MTKRTFDVLMILLIAGLLLILNKFNLMDKFKEFALILILAFYFLGKISERKFKD